MFCWRTFLFIFIIKDTIRFCYFGALFNYFINCYLHGTRISSHHSGLNHTACVSFYDLTKSYDKEPIPPKQVMSFCHYWTYYSSIEWWFGAVARWGGPFLWHQSWYQCGHMTSGCHLRLWWQSFPVAVFRDSCFFIVSQYISLIVAIVNDGMVQIVWRLPWNLWNVCWLMAKCSDIPDAIGPLALTSISGTTIMMHQFYVKSLWRIWRSRTRGWNTDTCMCTFFYLYSYWRWRLGCWIYFM